MIDDLIADGAILEVASREADKQPLKFSFHNFVLSDVGRDGPASFHATLSNPEPPGEITTAGKFGPWSEDDVGKTAVSGEYSFQQADLGVFGGIAGLLSSSGKFSGVLDRIEVQGLTDTPRFTVTSSSHQVQLRTSVPWGSERRERRHASEESGCNFLENDSVVGRQCGEKSRPAWKGRLGRTGGKGWADPGYSATVRPVAASADVWNG